jgi:hypothetical protein
MKSDALKSMISQILSLARLLMWRPTAALIDNGNIDNNDLL